MKIIKGVIQVAEIKNRESNDPNKKNHDIADLSKLKTHLSYHCTCMNQNETSWFQKKTNGYHSCLRVCLVAEAITQHYCSNWNRKLSNESKKKDSIMACVSPGK